MAGDVIFTEGGQLAAVAARQVESARQAEHQAFDADEAELRRRQAIVAASAAGVAGLIMLLLAFTGIGSAQAAADAQAERTPLNRIVPAVDEGIVSHARPAPAAPPPPSSPPVVRKTVVLKAAADLATDFGRVRDSDELSRLLARSADLIDATGLIVWMGSPSGSELRPVLTHGYAPQMLSRMRPVPRSADNAAAAAYRTGSLQIVLSRPGGASGAIVAPVLGPEGCIGALSAEIKGGGEGSEAVHAVTAIVAAHLASVLAASAVEEAAATEQPKAAAQM
jgi:hypothetical protein